MDHHITEQLLSKANVSYSRKWERHTHTHTHTHTHAHAHTHTHTHTHTPTHTHTHSNKMGSENTTQCFFMTLDSKMFLRVASIVCYIQVHTVHVHNTNKTIHVS